MPDSFSAADLTNGRLNSLSPPARLAVFGDPIAHSRSPDLHNAALAAAGINAQYVRIHATPEEFPASLRALAPNGFLGANITIPHKPAALAMVDEADDYARRAHAVNTVVADGARLLGFNTDGLGLVRAIREEFFVDLRDLRVMILGAGGGAGRAIAAQCAIENCERLVLVNRTLAKATALAAELAADFRSDRLVGPTERLAAIPHDPKAIAAELANVDIVINASSLGMRRSDPPALPPNLLTPNLLVYDTVYAGGPSRLVENATAAGARAAGGLSMLLHQGALSFEIWFNRHAPIDAMRSALYS